MFLIIKYSPNIRKVTVINQKITKNIINSYDKNNPTVQGSLNKIRRSFWWKLGAWRNVHVLRQSLHFQKIFCAPSEGARIVSRHQNLLDICCSNMCWVTCHLDSHVNQLICSNWCWGECARNFKHFYEADVWIIILT